MYLTLSVHAPTTSPRIRAIAHYSISSLSRYRCTFPLTFSLSPFHIFVKYRNNVLCATALSISPGAPGKGQSTIRASPCNPPRAACTPSGVSLREEKERAVTYQELRLVEGTPSVGKAQAPRWWRWKSRRRRRRRRWRWRWRIAREGREGRAKGGKAVARRIAREDSRG